MPARAALRVAFPVFRVVAGLGPVTSIILALSCGAQGRWNKPATTLVTRFDAMEISSKMVLTMIWRSKQAWSAQAVAGSAATA